MVVFIAAAVIIYSLFIIFTIFAAVQQMKSEKATSLRNRRPPKKFSLFRHHQTKPVLAMTAKSLSLWGFALAFLLTDLSDVTWSLNQTLSKFLSHHGMYETGYEIWTVLLPILTLFLFYEIHFHVFQWIVRPDCRGKCSFSFTAVNRASICVIGLYFVTTCILLEDTSKILSLFTVISLGRLFRPFFKYQYIIWAYPVRSLTDPWLFQETYDIAKRNKMTVKQIIIVKYPCMEHKGIKCYFGNVLVDSRILQWENDFDCDLPNLANLNDNYAPTVCQKEVRTMITHALGHWDNYHDLKISLIFICQLAGITAALVLSCLLSSELGQPIHVNIDLELYNETEISAIIQERRLRASCMGVLVVLLCFILPLIYASRLMHNFYRQRLDMAADQFTLANFQGQQLCQLLAKVSPTKSNDYPGHHWAYQILYPEQEAMILDRIALLKKSLEKIMYF